MSKKWTPDVSNTSEAITVGPPTRRSRYSRGSTKWTIKILKRMKGEQLAKWATIFSSWHGLPQLSVTYHDDLGLYVVQDDERHAFAHPKRVWTLFRGLRSRGKRMAYEYLLDQIPFEDNDLIVDIGANTGDLSLAFRVMGRKVRIEAFEPAPGEFAALQHNLPANSAVLEHRCHQIALWNEDSEGLTFYLKSEKGDSSVIPIPNPSGVVNVPGRRLDEVLSDTTGQIKLVKLEAEGAEPEILLGAVGLLPRIGYIAADVGFERGDDAQSTLPQVATFLIQHGFEIIGYEGSRNVLLFRNTATPE